MTEDKLSLEKLNKELDVWFQFYVSTYNGDYHRKAYEQLKSMLQPVPKYKIRELVEKTAHKFLMDNFVNEIPPIEKMPLDETARWMQVIEKLLYSTIQKYDKLKESADEKHG